MLNERLEVYNSILKQCGKQAGTQFVDILPVLQPNKKFNELYDDGLHPNAKEHKVIFQLVKKYFERN